MCGRRMKSPSCRLQCEIFPPNPLKANQSRERLAVTIQDTLALPMEITVRKMVQYLDNQEYERIARKYWVA